MNLFLRPARASDYPVIGSWISDAESCARWAGPQLAYPFDSTALPVLLDKPGAHALVLIDVSVVSGDADAPLGFAQYWQRDETRVHLGRIIVSPAARGKGYGKILCESLLSTALEHSRLPIVSLRVYRDNLAALSLYRQMGFKVVESDSNPDVLAMEYHRPAL